MKIADAECLQSKPYRVLTLVNSNLSGDYLIQAEGVLEMFKNYARQSWQLLTTHDIKVII